MLGFSFKKQILYTIVFKKVDAKDNRIIRAIIKSVKMVLLKRGTVEASHKFLGHSHCY